MRLALVGTVLVLAACSSKASDPPSTPNVDAGSETIVDGPLDTFIPAQMQLAAVPGLSAVIVKKGKVVWSGAYGLADVPAKTPVRPDTIFLVASVSKPFTGVALMQLVEEGKVKLDDPIDDYLPFQVTNPYHPTEKITVRQLMTHTGSIRESYIKLFTYIAPGDSKTPMRDFLESWLVKGGKEYNAGLNYSDKKPGTESSYSQLGAALVGYLVELVSGQPFDERVKQKVLVPLGMKDSSYRITDLDAARLAFPHVYTVAKGHTKIEHWGAPFYPAATMHTTPTELAKFMIAFMGDGSNESGRALTQKSVDEMLRIPFPAVEPNRGHLWEYREVNGQRVVGHNGGAPGVSTRMVFRKSDGVGVILLTNSDVHIRVSVEREEQNAAVDAIESRLFREADKL